MIFRRNTENPKIACKIQQNLIWHGIGLTSMNLNISCKWLNARMNPAVPAKEVQRNLSFRKLFCRHPAQSFKSPSKFVVPSQLDKGSCKFSPLLVRLSVDLSPPLEGFKQMPYDIFCSSVQFDLKNRICATCGIYFTSQKSVQTHSHSVRGKTTQDRREIRVRQQRFAASRASELLCTVRRCETSFEDADWFDADEVHASSLTIPEPPSPVLRMPVMKESEWLANP
ncbi:hypothetical protein EVAR_38733_1 [Eumeta japonica]|uniref:Uncharacterized protein n=1 Tax=Eumeta variegata TaxID=151549 RepID=A0A4C1YQI9_EUMVA|nr:hypothetical protein EVAR_38733_1 [Eumeta japonica]